MMDHRNHGALAFSNVAVKLPVGSSAKSRIGVSDPCFHISGKVVVDLL